MRGPTHRLLSACRPAEAQSATVTQAEAADLLGLSPSTLRYWWYQGTGPKGFRVGRRVNYRREDVDAWLKHQVDTTSRGDLDDERVTELWGTCENPCSGRGVDSSGCTAMGPATCLRGSPAARFVTQATDHR
ncbi:helix-turn-helix domain-containing protein [Mycolicibacterium sp. XJ2546]